MLPSLLKKPGDEVVTRTGTSCLGGVTLCTRGFGLLAMFWYAGYKWDGINDDDEEEGDEDNDGKKEVTGNNEVAGKSCIVLTEFDWFAKIVTRSITIVAALANAVGA